MYIKIIHKELSSFCLETEITFIKENSHFFIIAYQKSLFEEKVERDRIEISEEFYNKFTQELLNLNYKDIFLELEDHMIVDGWHLIIQFYGDWFNEIKFEFGTPERKYLKLENKLETKKMIELLEKISEIAKIDIFKSYSSISDSKS